MKDLTIKLAWPQICEERQHITTAAVAALHTSIQTHNFIQNWTEDAHNMWATQAQVDEDIQEEI